MLEEKGIIVENNGPLSSSCGSDSGSQVPIKQQNADKQPGWGGLLQKLPPFFFLNFGERNNNRENRAETSPALPGLAWGSGAPQGAKTSNYPAGTLEFKGKP